MNLDQLEDLIPYFGESIDFKVIIDFCRLFVTSAYNISYTVIVILTSSLLDVLESNEGWLRLLFDGSGSIYDLLHSLLTNTFPALGELSVFGFMFGLGAVLYIILTVIKWVLDILP